MSCQGISCLKCFLLLLHISYRIVYSLYYYLSLSRLHKMVGIAMKPNKYTFYITSEHKMKLIVYQIHSLTFTKVLFRNTIYIQIHFSLCKQKQCKHKLYKWTSFPFTLTQPIMTIKEVLGLHLNSTLHYTTLS